ncbi:dihydroxyacetone kinase subunit DhaL [Marinococcus luteus]|uniref:dihydroxyacetone kinase subunit DhaL n=1 Tax=Marinococcus luteus TaxID=1122204 RepID=UPI002ACCDF0D|nr:dihydroxyacetone kinase subunit DhaL [Marinococcus luteus]MDZ5783843.1 dihydroxyacetone kinase subunit DhaL [Marinococcus luteus]
MELSAAVMKQWALRINAKMQEHKDKLSELDQAIGDGDHGHNMARGFQEVANKVEDASYDDIGAMYKDVASTLISKVGGASGPLYGTAFLKAANAWKGKDVLDSAALTEGIEAAVGGIETRGKASLGDKTMLDVWIPVRDEMKEHGADAEKAAKTAANEAEATIDRIAKKGRASYLGERSKGHMDPGAFSSQLVFEALAEVYKEGAS